MTASLCGAALPCALQLCKLPACPSTCLTADWDKTTPSPNAAQRAALWAALTALLICKEHAGMAAGIKAHRRGQRRRRRHHRGRQGRGRGGSCGGWWWGGCRGRRGAGRLPPHPIFRKMGEWQQAGQPPSVGCVLGQGRACMCMHVCRQGRQACSRNIGHALCRQQQKQATTQTLCSCSDAAGMCSSLNDAADRLVEQLEQPSCHASCQLSQGQHSG